MMRAVVIFAFILAVNGQTTNIETCTWYGGELPINTYIEGCLQTPCPLPQRQDVVLHLVFRVPRNINRMRTVAGAFVPPLPFPITYPLAENGETCNFLENSFCPVLEGEILQYTLRMYIEEFFPLNTQATIEFRIQDDSNQPFICIRVPISIVPAIDSRSGNNTLAIGKNDN